MGGIIDVIDLTVAYDRQPAVHHVSGSFARGSLTAVVGPNGAGKSTLIKTIVGLMNPSTGRVERHGLGRRAIAYLPQQAEIDRSFPINVADTVALGLWNEIGLWGSIKPKGWKRIADALAHVGLEGFGHHPIAALSAGQFQRVLFARLLLQDSAVILLDEPFAAIDERTTADLLAIIHHWHEEGRTVIAVLHDMEQVRQHFPQTLLMARELIGWGATSQVLTDEALRRARAIAQGWTNNHNHATGHAA
ncbi:ATP-binding cassette domain-containing protein [Parvibaculum sedimenti]|uniref:ATP-binding cassette domain-containing protein n=1 Tax=Parvibaculum sedimenti TaxID=2608632 RepID=A0A6N6VFX5_9HYPH|nr:metal ABC transporter ATP-binding protein [Parvibaculum sedimenti]KAB7739544.1 ATP-binding cassette domain-containing protein [Parvibaculum sedimenti]